MSKIGLATEYALMARVLARDIATADGRSFARSKARSLPRMEEADVGFLKARCASWLRSLALNIDQVPEASRADVAPLLIHTANFLLMLPDASGHAAPDRGPARQRRYTPGVD